MIKIFKNKKAVSDVITTVLIILLVLAAVAIIGGILLRNIGEAGSKIGTSQGCIELDVQPVSCSGLANTVPANVGVRVLAQRGSRGSNLDISKLNAIIVKGDGTTVSGVAATVPVALATATIDVVTNTPRKSASISATLRGADGSEQTCEPSNVKVDCGLGSGSSVSLDATGTRAGGAAGAIIPPGSGYSIGAKIIVDCTTDAVISIISVDASGGVTGIATDTVGSGCTIGRYNF